MFAKLLDAIFGIRDGGSWIDLDDRMRGQLRFWGVMSVFALLVLIVSSLYFYLQWPPVKTFVDSILQDVQKSMKDKGEIPKWVVTVGGFWFGLLTVLSLIFFYFLIDFGKAHYKIDAISLRIIPRVSRYIRSATLEKLECPGTSECALYAYSISRTGGRRFKNECFYHFANADNVGPHNQADKRRQVFGFWTKYYVFNYVMLIVTLAWLWLCFIVFLKAPSWVAALLAAYLILHFAFWCWRGRYYKQGALDLAADQISAFFAHARPDVIAQASALVDHCGFQNCTVKTRSIVSP